MKKETQEKYTAHILKFLEERPYISLEGLERACEIPRGTIAQAKLGSRLLPVRAIFIILAELAKCGITDIYGYELSYDEEVDCLFGRKFTKELRTIEVLHLKDGTKHRRVVTPEMEEVAVDEDGNMYNPFYDKDPFRDKTTGTSYEYEILEDRVMYSDALEL